MKVKTIAEDALIIFEMEGKLVLGGESEVSLLNLFDKYIDKGYKNFIFDLNKMKYIDSSGIGKFAAILAKAKNLKIKVVMCAVPPKIYELLQITHLTKVYDIYESTEDAKKHLK